MSQWGLVPWTHYCYHMVDNLLQVRTKVAAACPKHNLLTYPAVALHSGGRRNLLSVYCISSMGQEHEFRKVRGTTNVFITPSKLTGILAFPFGISFLHLRRDSLGYRLKQALPTRI